MWRKTGVDEGDRYSTSAQRRGGADPLRCWKYLAAVEYQVDKAKFTAPAD
jgi:hypothetical protein